MKSFTELPVYFSLLALGVSALPSPNAPAPKRISEIINFEDKVGNPIVPAGNPIGVDKGLNFVSFVSEADTLSAVGVKPHSPPTAAVTAIEQQGITGTPTITSSYLGSPVKYFDLKSFWFGCAVNSVENAEGVATQCTIFVAGFLKSNQEKVVATYTYSPTLLAGGTLKPMIQAVLPSEFVGLQNVTLIQDNPTTKAMLIDDVAVVLWE